MLWKDSSVFWPLANKLTFLIITVSLDHTQQILQYGTRALKTTWNLLFLFQSLAVINSSIVYLYMNIIAISCDLLFLIETRVHNSKTCHAWTQADIDTHPSMDEIPRAYLTSLPILYSNILQSPSLLAP